VLPTGGVHLDHKKEGRGTVAARLPKTVAPFLRFTVAPHCPSGASLPKPAVVRFEKIEAVAPDSQHASLTNPFALGYVNSLAQPGGNVSRLRIRLLGWFASPAGSPARRPV
jgi:hypothetical protein